MNRIDDLISRQAAIDALVDENIVDHMDTVYDSELHRCKRAIERILSQLPSVERKKGEWIEISSINHTYRCSECGRLLVNVADGRNNVSKHYPYCHCGADMREGKEDETD